MSLYDEEFNFQEDEEPEQETAQVRFVSRIRETDKALLFDFAKKPDWIPLSQITEMHTEKDGTGYVTMSTWIAKKKGLI